ncbi:MAG: tetratricopeptide repeat protein [Acidobacteria bacterium]|nr:tetratricopeptide repeat protein [Acidobacteriota bacterium]
MPAKSTPQIRLLFLFIYLLAAVVARAADQQWLRVSSDHFVVLTDAGERKGHDIAARFEQMRAVFAQLLVRSKLRMAEPIEIIAVANHPEYSKLAPPGNGNSITTGFTLQGADRVYIVLDASYPESWRAVERSFGRYLLDYNYPPTQAWFDEGFVDYFASLYFTPTRAELGGDAGPFSITDEQNGNGKSRSFADILERSDWLPFPALLGMTHRREDTPGEKDLLFSAESWMLTHYLLNRNKLTETGTYFGLVEIQRIPPAEAVAQAYGMPLANLETAVKEYFHSLRPKFMAASESTPPGVAAHSPLVQELPLPITTDDVASSARQVPAWEAQALVDEMEVRIPERRSTAVEQLRKLVANSRNETSIAHRALAWAYLEQGEIPNAFQELNAGVTINPSDPWTRMGLAFASYRSGEKGARVQGLANMMESLHIVVTRYPEYAEAYNLLGWARLAGGGANAAIESMRVAVGLSPRNEDYRLRLAEAYIAAKKWEDAVAALERLKLSEDPQIAAAADKDLHEVPFLKKFGVLPADAQASKPGATTAVNPGAENAEESAEAEPEHTPAAQASTPQVDKRPIQFLKAKLLAVDCSKAPEAVLKILSGRKTLRLRTSNYESLLVLGREKFSCEWKDIAVGVNYKAGGKMDGDLLSLELQ